MKTNYIVPLIWLYLLAFTLLLTVPRRAEAIGHPYLVKNINPYANAFDTTATNQLTVLNDFIVFAANDGVTGIEPWKSDGTPAGTQLLTNIKPGLNWSAPASLITVNGRTLFTADDGIAGRELWVSDGTSGGTQLLKDINAGSDGSTPDNFTLSNGSLFFTAYTPTTGRELWRTDGTPEGTVMVKEFTTGTSTTTFGSLTAAGNRLLIVTYLGQSTWELWQSDGTNSGTVPVRTFSGMQPQYLTPCNGLTFFSASDSSNGNELWTTDGSDSGTLLVQDINPGTASSSPANLTCVGNKLFFSAEKSNFGKELWKSDGTPTGTLLVKDIYAGVTGSAPDNFVGLNDRVLFRASTAEAGQEVWQSDGTDAGTTLLIDAQPGSGSSYPKISLVGSGKAFFDLSAASGTWVTDGTSGGTFRFTDTYSAKNFGAIGNTLFFSAYGGSYGNELWAVSLVPSPITLITTPVAGLNASEPVMTISGASHSDTGAPVARVEISTDGGTTWSDASGTTSWNYSWTAPGQGNYVIKARATDSNGMVEPEPATISITIDTDAPTATMTISNDATSTPYQSVTLNITASATEPEVSCASQPICGNVQMRFSNDGNSWSSWENGLAAKQWLLAAGDGPKTVYMQARDRAGNVVTVSDTILFDSSVLPTIYIGSPYDKYSSTSRTITLMGTATDHSGTGLNRIEVAAGNGPWTLGTIGLTSWWFSVRDLPDGIHTIKARAIDNAGYISATRSILVVVDATPPTGSIVINNDAAFTASNQVTLSIAATDPWGIMCAAIYPPPFGCEPHYVSMSLSSDGVFWGGWQNVTPTLSWNLNGSSTVHVKFRDIYGNTSQTYSDSIIVLTPPTSSILQPTNNSFSNQGTLTITGSAAPSAGASLLRVEVSTNGGTTWQMASGTSSWSFPWSPAEGTYNLRSRAVDTSASEAPSSGITVTIDRTPPAGSISSNYLLNAPDGLQCFTYPCVNSNLSMLLPGSSTWQPVTTVLPFGTTSVSLRDRAGNIGLATLAGSVQPVRLEQPSPVFYALVQPACDNALSGNIIKLVGTTFTENLSLTRNIAVTLQGGYDNSHGMMTGSSVINGSVTASAGTTTLENLEIHGNVIIDSGILVPANVTVL